MKSRILKGLYHFTVYAVGVLVLLAAVVVTLVRLFLPDIGIYRNEVEAWVSKYMGYPVVIHTIDANWQGWTPELTLTNIDLLNKAGTEEITHFDTARIQIAPLATLVERQIIPKSLIISGFELSITRHENGSISVQDIELENINKKQSDNELAEWLFKQDEIEIQHGQIEWIDLKYKQDEPILLNNVSFRMRNDIGRVQIDGSTNLPDSYGKTMDFAFDVFGNLLTSDWSGELYLSANDINPDNWYRNIRPVEFNLTGGTANIKVWMNWEKAKLASLQGNLKYNDFDASIRDKQVLSLNSVATSFRGERFGKEGWRFNVKLDNFVTENGAWPDTQITITREPTAVADAYRYITGFSYLKIGDLVPLLSKLSLLPDKAKSFLNNISINGELYDGTLQYDQSDTDTDQFIFNTRFNNLAANLGDKLPSLSGLKGRIQGTPTQGQLVLQDSTAKFRMPSDDDKTIDVLDLKGNVRWLKTDHTWKLQTDRISVNTGDLDASLYGSVSKTDGDSPFLDLVMNMGKSDLEKLSDYLPESQKFRLRKWMNKALLGGVVDSASALLRGNLKDFPFDNGSGRFQIIAEVSNATLEYSRLWPVADQLYGEVKINGRHMQTHIQNGRIFNADITTADVSIEDILKKKKTVNITGHMTGNIHDLALFIDKSPLQNHATLAEIRRAMQSGEFGLDLKLGIPLKQKGDKKPEINGTIAFSQTVMDSPAMKIHVDDIHGKVSFTGESVSSRVLNAEYQGSPVTITLAGTKSDSDHPYTITLSGQGDDRFIIDRLVQYVPVTTQLEKYLRSKISGTTSWQAQLSYTEDEQSNLEKKLLITSSLKGLQIDLPNPAGKRKFSTTPVTIQTVLSRKELQTVRISYNTDISCLLQLDKRAEKILQQVHLYIGRQQEPPESTGKFIISGNVDNLNVNNWITFLSSISTGEENPHPVLNDIDMDLKIAHLDLFSQDYFDVDAVGRKNDWGWSFNVDSENIKGDVYYPTTKPGRQQLTLLLNKLGINESNGRNQGLNAFDPRKLPVLSVAVDDFNYLGRDMGALSMETSSIYNGAAIDRFEFKKDRLLINGNGTWLADGGMEQSKFKIDLHAKDISSMLDTFGYDLSSIKNGETELQIIADWPGSPMNFSLKNLNGRLDMQIKDGQLLDVNPSAGRIFGLLSFQTLPRRLLLDFRDLFSKGLSFDKIDGEFDITNGNAYTNNLVIDSPAANVSISGRTGLAEKDYDQLVTVTPQVSESMPVAGALFGPVGIGVGAMIYLMGEMFNSLNTNIDNLLKYQYTITGSWDNPIIERIKEDEVVAGG